MPAVRTFSFFAGTAVFINFLLQVCISNTVYTHFTPLQITVFTAVLSLDSKRIANNRPDILCCIHLKKDEKNEETQESLLFLFMKNCYAPFLLHRVVRLAVV